MRLPVPVHLRGPPGRYAANTRVITPRVQDPGVGPQEVTYTYDPVGNRTSDTVNGTRTLSTFDVNDQLTARGTDTFAYDGNGNQTRRQGPSGTTVFDYDARGRLTAATTAAGTVRYGYDADQNLVTTTATTGAVTTHLVDTNRALPQTLTDTTTGQTTAYTWDHRDQLTATTTTGSGNGAGGPGDGTMWAVTDYLGSVRATTGGTGALITGHAYDPFGAPLAQTTTYGYNSQRHDPTTSAIHLRARWYTPDTARFTTTDPWEGSLSEPDTQPDYYYAAANPLTNTDPTGLLVAGTGDLAKARTINAPIESSQAAAHVTVMAIFRKIIASLTGVTARRAMAGVLLAGVHAGALPTDTATQGSSDQAPSPAPLPNGDSDPHGSTAEGSRDDSGGLSAFGNRGGPRAPRAVDMEIGPDGKLVPQGPIEPVGASTFADPLLAPLSGHYHTIPEDLPMPPGLAVVRDGVDVGGTRAPTHATIYATVPMTPDTFVSLFLSLPWRYGGKK